MSNFRHKLQIVLTIGTIMLTRGITAAPSSQDMLQTELDAAIKSGKNKIVLTQPEYRLTRPVVISNLQNRTIDGNGARIIVTTSTPKRSVGAMIITNQTRDVTFRNFTIDYDPVPFTQGTVTEVKGQEIHFKLDQGYPVLESGRIGGCHTHIFTSDGRFWKKNQRDVYGYVESRGDGWGYVESIRPLGNISPGDRIAIDWRGRTGAQAIDMHGKTGNLRFENITILASPGVAFRCYHGEGGDVFRNCRIERGARLPDMEHERLLSTVADGIHFGYARKGITIEGCDFGYMGDDGVNLHGPLLVVAEFTGERTMNMIAAGKTNKSSLLSRLEPGTKLRMLDPETYQILGYYTYRSSRFLPGKQYPESEVRALHRRMNALWAQGVHSVFEVTVDEKIKLPQHVIFDVPAVNCNGYRIVDNNFHDHRARGLRVMASNGVIENNRFERIKGPAITALAEYANWGECGWIENLAIRNNIVKECGFQQNSIEEAKNDYAFGAISVCAQLGNYVRTVPEHRNIIITGNRIENVPFAGIFLLGVKNGRVTDNTLINTANAGYAPGVTHFGNSVNQPIRVLYSGKIELKNNTVSK